MRPETLRVRFLVINRFLQLFYGLDAAALITRFCGRFNGPTILDNLHRPDGLDADSLAVVRVNTDEMWSPCLTIEFSSFDIVV